MSAEDEYPSNSNTSRLRPSVPVSPPKGVKPSERQPEKAEDRPAAEKVIEGSATPARKPVGARFRAIFTGVSPKDIVDDVVDTVIIPGTMNLLHDMGLQALDRLFGKSTSRVGNAARTMVTNATHVAYNRFSQPGVQAANVRPADTRPPGPVSMSRRGAANFDFEELEFETRQDATIILELMYDHLEQYGSVSVAEFYGWADVRGNFTDRNWGWKSLEGSGPTRTRSGRFVLNLPAPTDLNR
jgi:hypothetical protein